MTTYAQTFADLLSVFFTRKCLHCEESLGQGGLLCAPCTALLSLGFSKKSPSFLLHRHTVLTPAHGPSNALVRAFFRSPTVPLVKTIASLILLSLPEQQEYDACVLTPEAKSSSLRWVTELLPFPEVAPFISIRLGGVLLVRNSKKLLKKRVLFLGKREEELLEALPALHSFAPFLIDSLVLF